MVLSKNYNASGFLGFHGGVNYSLERSDGDRDLNLFVGIDKTLGSFLSLIAEYNPGLNDNGPHSFGRGRGYLNAGIAASPGAGISIAFHFKDILGKGYILIAPVGAILFVLITFTGVYDWCFLRLSSAGRSAHKDMIADADGSA